jgi:hypothetical protein
MRVRSLGSPWRACVGGEPGEDVSQNYAWNRLEFPGTSPQGEQRGPAA